jgi:hypothetical protein
LDKRKESLDRREQKLKEREEAVERREQEVQRLMEQVQKAKQIVSDIQKSLKSPPVGLPELNSLDSFASSENDSIVNVISGKFKRFGISTAAGEFSDQNQPENNASNNVTTSETPCRPVDAMLISPCNVLPLPNSCEFESPSAARRQISTIYTGLPSTKRLPLSTKSDSHHQLGSSPPLPPPIHRSRPTISLSAEKNSSLYWKLYHVAATTTTTTTDQ